MKETPILFSAPMIRAIREHRKTQTRRVAKKNLPFQDQHGTWIWRPDGKANSSQATSDRPSFEVPQGWARQWCPYGGPGMNCPGKGPELNYPGDRLWAREKQLVIARAEAGNMIRVQYLADGAESDWLPYPPRLRGFPHVGRCLSYGGYRESSRITMENMGVRLEQLQEITAEDCCLEGLGESDWQAHGTLRKAFAHLWDSINEKRGHGWNKNDWVFVLSFKWLEGS